MNKLALIGGEEIAKYTVADKMWEIISKVSGIKFTFEVTPLESREDLESYFNKFLSSSDFLGFNVALPWKNDVSRMVDKVLPVAPGIYSVNTVYKKNNITVGVNTDVIGIVNAYKFVKGIDPKGDVLILGAGGAGLSTAHYLSRIYDLKIYLYDVSPIPEINNNPSIVPIDSLSELATRKYDHIINATPLGKYHLNSRIVSFSTPLDLNILNQVSKATTTLQDMNYFPRTGLFQQLGESLNLGVVPGYLMLVFQALESYQKYFNHALRKEEIDRIIKEMISYISTKEIEVLNINSV